jgi:hypothetical protein
MYYPTSHSCLIVSTWPSNLCSPMESRGKTHIDTFAEISKEIPVDQVFPIEIVSKVILRHANLSTTQRYLGKFSDAEGFRWIENLYGQAGQGGRPLRDLPQPGRFGLTRMIWKWQTAFDRCSSFFAILPKSAIRDY